ncbi:MAG: hypothetical protein JJT95_10530 [Pararhodobacter sp.]|nr:hypothetical protein [Pararhodobacter sp.]
MLRFLVRGLVALAAALIVAAPPAPASADGARTGGGAGGVDALLAPFESGAPMPPLIAGLPLAEGRAYAILVQIVPPYVANMQDPNSVRRAMIRGLNPIAVERAGTQLGHAMVGWRCADGRFGLTGKTSEDSELGEAMLRDGWGMAAVLSEFRFGRLHRLDELDPGWLRALERGAVRVVAFEIGAADCQRMRQALARYLTHPQRPEIRYTNLPDPALMRGDGCASFALWLAGEGGVFAGIGRDLFWREVELRDSFIGHGTEVPEGVVPFRMAEPGHEIGVLRLMLGDWSTGRVLGRARGIDPELMTLALDRAYARAGQPRERRLPGDDALAQRVDAAAERWLGGFGRITPVRMGRARAVVMHRR